ncbi:MAG: hypothetical protein M3N68_02415 [Actinomycetota bacterium]|nr:hypothetical protein [Actinomycetota bacterium]
MGAFALDVVDDLEKTAIALHLVSCAECRHEADRYRRVALGLASTRERTWERVSEALTARREELEDFLGRLAGMGAPQAGEGTVPSLRVVVASDTGTPRFARHIDEDRRFTVVGTAEEASGLAAVTVAQRPDLLVVALSEPLREWLDCVGEVGRWSPGTKVVMVSGLDTETVARMVSSSGTAVLSPGDEPAQPGATPRRPGGCPPNGRSRQAAQARPAGSTGRRAARRSIIDEAMWQMGISGRDRQ